MNVRTNYDSDPGSMAYLQRVREKRGDNDVSEFLRRNWLINEHVRKDRGEWTPEVAENYWRGFPRFHDEVVQAEIDSRKQRENDPVLSIFDMLFDVFGVGGQR